MTDTNFNWKQVGEIIIRELVEGGGELTEEFTEMLDEDNFDFGSDSLAEFKAELTKKIKSVFK